LEEAIENSQEPLSKEPETDDPLERELVIEEASPAEELSSVPVESVNNYPKPLLVEDDEGENELLETTLDSTTEMLDLEDAEQMFMIETAVETIEDAVSEEDEEEAVEDATPILEEAIENSQEPLSKEPETDDPLERELVIEEASPAEELSSVPVESVNNYPKPLLVEDDEGENELLETTLDSTTEMLDLEDAEQMFVTETHDEQEEYIEYKTESFETESEDSDLLEEIEESTSNDGEHTSMENQTIDTKSVSKEDTFVVEEETVEVEERAFMKGQSFGCVLGFRNSGKAIEFDISSTNLGLKSLDSTTQFDDESLATIKAIDSNSPCSHLPLVGQTVLALKADGAEFEEMNDFDLDVLLNEITVDAENRTLLVATPESGYTVKVPLPSSVEGVKFYDSEQKGAFHAVATVKSVTQESPLYGKLEAGQNVLHLNVNGVQYERMGDSELEVALANTDGMEGRWLLVANPGRKFPKDVSSELDKQRLRKLPSFDFCKINEEQLNESVAPDEVATTEDKSEPVQESVDTIETYGLITVQETTEIEENEERPSTATRGLDIVQDVVDEVAEEISETPTEATVEDNAVVEEEVFDTSCALDLAEDVVDHDTGDEVEHVVEEVEMEEAAEDMECALDLAEDSVDEEVDEVEMEAEAEPANASNATGALHLAEDIVDEIVDDVPGNTVEDALDEGVVEEEVHDAVAERGLDLAEQEVLEDVSDKEEVVKEIELVDEEAAEEVEETPIEDEVSENATEEAIEEIEVIEGEAAETSVMERGIAAADSKAYLQKVKSRFANEPEKYVAFLNVMGTYEEALKEVDSVIVEKVQDIFIPDHADLMNQFYNFVPSSQS